MTINDNLEAFDWAWAMWYWLSHNYGGAGCTKYACMNTLTIDHKLGNIPSIDFDNNDCDEYEMSVIYYHELDENNWQEYFDTLNNYLTNDYEERA